MIVGGLNLLLLFGFELIILVFYNDKSPLSKLPWANTELKLEFLKQFKKMIICVILIYEPKENETILALIGILILNLMLAHSLITQPYFLNWWVYCVECGCIVGKTVYGLRIIFVASLQIQTIYFLDILLAFPICLFLVLHIKQRKVTKIMKNTSVVYFANKEQVQDVIFLVLKWLTFKS